MGCPQQEETLRGDKAPLERLKQRQADLAQLQSTTNGWGQRVKSRFDDLQRTLTRQTQEAANGFRAQFDEEIRRSLGTVWRHLSFPAELEMVLRRITVDLERSLAEGVLEAAGEAARDIGIDDLPVPTQPSCFRARNSRPRSVDSPGSRQSRALGAVKIILTEVAQTLRSIVTSGRESPHLAAGAHRLGSAIVGVVNAKGQCAGTEQDRGQAAPAGIRRSLPPRARSLWTTDRGAKDETVAARSGRSRRACRRSGTKSRR